MGRSCDDATKARCNDLLRASALAESGLRLPPFLLLLEWAAVLAVEWWVECVGELWEWLADEGCFGLCGLLVVCATAAPPTISDKAENRHTRPVFWRQSRVHPWQGFSFTIDPSNFMPHYPLLKL